jgi:transposase
VPITAIATTVGISRRFVYKWAERFVQESLEGLVDKLGRGPRHGPCSPALPALNDIGA